MTNSLSFLDKKIPADHRPQIDKSAARTRQQLLQSIGFIAARVACHETGS